ncbi:hypothetical protein PF005_g13320 [Phytophthora fragariae]|uniref:RxLR effector protein n=1 Tax=Phytophthora fragariae TaxID=53985 RepID=A0A6A3XQ65_9STRA|nr:hypothetical protein PF005_g13320 [Phytophthora fragariae]KAE9228991.1 hypothetical protein PF004_g10913 [Phytophthora fragariae]KAE9239299.1 hypothetical protein PF002_g10350 [Phytophthora fragariae]
MRMFLPWLLILVLPAESTNESRALLARSSRI